MRSGPVRPRPGPGIQLEVTPASAGWTYLGFSVVEVAPGSRHLVGSPDRETAIVTLSGRGVIEAGGSDVAVARSSVFAELAPVVYLPPGETAVVRSDDGLTVAIGSAPAEPGLPVRVVDPSEMPNEVRGGGQAYRQVVHSLAPPTPAQRLIVYEVYVPRGTWSGWPPHCHDGREGSPYLEETYYFRLDRPEGFAMHRNWRADEGFDETVVLADGETALVPLGYHSSVACPGANMYFLNFLAGDLIGDARATPPCFAAEHTWITEDWNAGAWELPILRR